MSKNSLTSFLLALKSANVEKIKAAYSSSSEEEQIEALKFLFQSAKSADPLYGHYQDITTLCLQAGNFPSAMISAINSIEKFAFFSTPLFQTAQITNQNSQGNNVLHVLLATLSAEEQGLNYLRTLLHFESKAQLQDAFSHRNNKQLTPIECYLAFNPHTAPLALQELSALLGLIEVERQHIATEVMNANTIESHLAQHHRLTDYKQFLLATYYQSQVSG
ncbi:hypothetical protein [Pseudoalteromonas piscicida]|uniref:hypothetical protein n=1 Tax=Pseudoalteromonas piscicida TaxID=43662 RepID=UPI0030A6581D